MPRHTWTVRIELCETYDAVYAHAFLESGPVHLTGHGKANVTDITTAVTSRAAAARRSLADLSQAMLAAQEHPSAHRPSAPVEVPAQVPAPVSAPVSAGTRSEVPAPAHLLEASPPWRIEPDVVPEPVATRVYSLSLGRTSASAAVVPAFAG